MIEICTEENSTLSQAAADFDGVGVVTVTKDDDFDKKTTQDWIKEMIREWPGTSVHGSLPCTAWSPRQAMNLAQLGPEHGQLRFATDDVTFSGITRDDIHDIVAVVDIILEKFLHVGIRVQRH